MSPMLVEEQDPETETMEPAQRQLESEGRPEKPELPDRLPEEYRLSSHSAIFALTLGLTFWFCCLRPLWHTDVWGHLTYGEWIWNHRQVPKSEPLMPLAEGVPWVDTAWLSQLGTLGLWNLWGLVGLQFFFAATVTISAGLLARSLYSVTRSAIWSVVGVGLLGLLNWQQLFVDFPSLYALWRPQLAGLVCYLAVFNWLASNRIQKQDWILIPGIFVLWANLHGSFLIGLGLIGVWTLGRAGDLFRRTGQWSVVWSDRRTMSWLMILELSAVAALMNPYGLSLYFEVLNFASSPNLQELLDWEPLTIRRSQGQWFVAMVVALAIAYRHSPRRVSFSEAMLLIGLGLWTLWTSRILVWWTVPACYFLIVQLWAGLEARQRRREPFVPPARKGLWTVATIGLCWIFFAISPFGVRVMHGRQLDFRKSVSLGTPVDAVDFLKKEQPSGLIYNAYEWGDYLRWAGGPQMRIFLNSHAHLVPPEVWRAYRSIASGSTSSVDLLDRYGAQVVFVDLARHQELVSTLKKSNQWSEVYRDGIAVILTRNRTSAKPVH